jgi:hypothetical protein
MVRYEAINDRLGNPNPNIRAFVSASPPPNLWTIVNRPDQQIYYQTMHVEVEGHVLGQQPEPAIKDRVIVFTPPDGLVITWP